MRKVILTLLLAMIAFAASAQRLAMTDANGVLWVCGGVGAEERRELAALEARANLALTFVTLKRGGYLADVEVTLYEAGAKSARFKTTADGPICLLRLPAGRYRIEAAHGGAKRSAQAALAQDAQRPVRLGFAFPGEPWDGIWASDEEKRQAKEP